MSSEPLPSLSVKREGASHEVTTDDKQQDKTTHPALHG